MLSSWPPTALGNAAFPEASVKASQYQTLVGTPQRGNQKGFWPVSGEAVDHHPGRKECYTVNDQIQVFLHGRKGKGAAGMNVRKICTLQNMEQLQLDALDILACQITDGSKHFLTAFTGKAKDHMDNGLQMVGPQPFQCVFKAGQGIAPADAGSRILVDGLEAQLDPHGFDLIQPGEKMNNLTGQAVRTRGYGENPDQGMPDGSSK